MYACAYSAGYMSKDPSHVPIIWTDGKTTIGPTDLCLTGPTPASTLFAGLQEALPLENPMTGYSLLGHPIQIWKQWLGTSWLQQNHMW